jgi:hypothetical protein
MNNRFNDPFYAESSWVRSAEESGDYDQPAGPANNPSTLPPGWSVTGDTGTGNTGATTTTSGGGKVNWSAILQNAPQIIGAVGGIVGSVKQNAGAGGTQDSVKAVCGRKPLFNIGGKKDKYRACAERVLNPPKIQELPPPGMSTTSKVLIGVGIVVFLGLMVFIVIKVSKNKSN